MAATIDATVESTAAKKVDSLVKDISAMFFLEPREVRTNLDSISSADGGKWIPCVELFSPEMRVECAAAMSIPSREVKELYGDNIPGLITYGLWLKEIIRQRIIEAMAFSYLTQPRTL